jgi:23S rRNA (guanosine2251-2'-O)-methyltransferase
MVERSRRGKGKHRRKEELLGSHARSWIWGRNLVGQTLAAGRWPIVELYLADDLPAHVIEEAQSQARQLGAKVELTDRERLEQLGHTGEHQGFLARMGPFPYVPPDDLLTATTNPLFLILDRIQDPFNFGAIVRSAGAFGVDGIFVGRGGQAPVTSQVARSSAGIVNRVPIAQVDNLAEFVPALARRKVRVIGASEKADHSLTDCRFGKSTALIIGNEGVGMAPELAACCDELARIPIDSAVGSLNAAAAAAVFLFEIHRQRASARAE